MDGAADTLPDDVKTFQAMLLAERALTAEAKANLAELAPVTAERKRLEAEFARLTAQNERHEHIIAQLRRLTFGKRSEQPDKDQLQLALEDLQRAAAEIEADEERGDTELKAHRARQRREKRPSLPDHLPQVVTLRQPRPFARAVTAPCI
jgi:hypothetical protein